MRRQLLVYSLIAITIGVVLFATNFKLLGGISEYGGADNAIHVMNADGSSVKRTTSYGQNSMAVWSPDSSKIAFLFSPRYDRDGDDLYVMSTDGVDKVKLNDTISGSVKGFVG